jgi:hypothetical protein
VRIRGRRNFLVPGLVVVDATFLQHLASPATAAEIRRQCRAADLRIRPTKINAIEVIKDPSPLRRKLLAEAIKQWCDGEILLPWPPQILRLAGRAAANGQSNCMIPRDLWEVIDPEDDDVAADQARAKKWVDDSEAAFAKAHADVRGELQTHLKARGLRDRWPTAAEFLDEEWSSPENVAHFTQLFWTHFELEGKPPGDLLALSEVWRLFIDAFGTAVYDRAVAREQKGNPPGVMDLLQIIYLSMHTRARIFVTDDKALSDAARAVLSGRYPNVRVMSGLAFLERLGG